MGEASYLTFLNQVIDEGIAAATKDYKDDEQKRLGSVEGFEACRGKTPKQIAELRKDAEQHTRQARMDRLPTSNYWRTRCFEAEIEWVCNVLSAAFIGQFSPIVPPTARGAMMAHRILAQMEAGEAQDG